jgi:hypothetical protein
VLAAAAYLAFAVAITWPFALHPGSTLFGGVGSDLTGSVARFRELADAGQPPFLPGHVPDFDAPGGLTTQWTLDLASFPSSAMLWLGSVAFGGVAAYGLLAIINFAGSALAMFLLTRWLTGSAGAGFVAGTAFGFWPYVFATATQPLGSGWVFVLLVWRMIVVLRQPSLRNGVWAGLAGVLVLAWIQYWLLIGGVLYAVLACAVLFLAHRRGEARAQLRAQSVAAALLASWVLLVFVIGSVTAFTDVPVRSGTDAIRYSARPLMYLLPSPHHPLLGDLTEGTIRDRYMSADSTAAYTAIYVGVVTLVLAAWGLLSAWRRDARSQGALTGKEISLIAVALILVAGLLSGPPEVNVLGTTIPTPVKAVTEVTSVFRSVARFAHLVMLGLCLLMALGVATLVDGRSRTVRGVLVVGLAAIVALDLWNLEPPGPTRVVYPPVLTRLADRPPGILVEYPVLAAVNSGSEATFYQQAHGHPLFNGFRRDTESESLKLELQALKDPRTPPELARLGVRYVLVRDIKGGIPGVPPAGSQINGMRLIDRDGYGALYRLTAQPATNSVHALSGFTIPEGDPVRFIRWMSKRTARLEVRAGCTPCEGTLRIATGTYLTPRHLVIRNEAGREVAAKTISSESERFAVPIEVSGRGRFTFEISPSPQAPADVDPNNPDTRPLGIFLSYPVRFVPRGQNATHTG